MMPRLLVLLFLCASAASAANTVYIAPTSAGSNNGTSCGNAYAVSYFNTAGNWNASPTGTQIGPDTTVNLCSGNYIGAANSTVLGFHLSGTSGHPIILMFQAGAVVEAPYCAGGGSGGCIDLEGHSYITIDGGGVGIVENTANGTGLTYQQTSSAIQANGTIAGFTLQNLTIQNIYVHTSPSDSAIGDNAAVCVYENGAMTNWTITGNTMHDMSWCISLQYNTSSNLTFSNNNIYNVDHGIALGGPGAGYTLSNVNIYGNNIHDYSNWDTSGNTYHHDGVHMWGYSDNGSDTIAGVNIYNNTFGGCIGQNVTAHIFMEANGGGTSNVLIYNNTLLDTCSGNDGDGLLTTGIDSGYKIYNNVFAGASTDVCVGTSSSPSITFENNAVSTCGTLMYITSAGGFAASGLNHNVYANSSGSNAFSYHGAYFASFATWQTDTGQDASPSQYAASAGLNSSGVPQPASVVIGNGVNLSGLGITPLDSDLLGNARGGGAWDIGAYKFLGGPTPVITSPTFVTGEVGKAFTYQITATNTPTSYGASSLPSGCSVNTGTGLVSCTVTTAGTTSASVNATNSNGTGSQGVSFIVTPITISASPLSIG